MNPESRVFVAGASGMVGQAIVRRLRNVSYRNLQIPGHHSLDLTNQSQTALWFKENRPEYVFLAAAKVGGILANSVKPADFIRDNLAIQSNVIECSRVYGVKRLVFFGSSCIYPRDCRQPLLESDLMTGPLEPTNAPYAIAKIAGVMMLQAYGEQYGLNSVCLMPSNLYGPHDRYSDPSGSHVIPALMSRIHEAKRLKSDNVTIWGTGEPLREFLHVNDLADAAIMMMHRDEVGVFNVGSGREISIMELARLLARVIGFKGLIRTDTSYPDGTPRKVMDSSLIRTLGWAPKVELEAGLAAEYRNMAGMKCQSAA